MDPQTEQAAIRAAQADPRRFTPLYENYFPDIFRFIHRRANDAALTADLVQETFLKALLALPRYVDRGSPFRAWLYRIALNELRMHWRKRKEVLVDLSFREVKGLSEDVGVAVEQEALDGLAHAMGRLDEEKTRMIELRYMDGMTFLEMGQVLGISEDAAKMRTHRVLATLRDHLKPRA